MASRLCPKLKLFFFYACRCFVFTQLLLIIGRISNLPFFFFARSLFSFRATDHTNGSYQLMGRQQQQQKKNQKERIEIGIGFFFI